MKRGISKDSDEDVLQPKRKPPPTSSSAAGRQTFGHWSTKLLDTMKDPHMIVKEDEMIVIIRDAYPKAKHHFLVLPKDNISNLRALDSSHLPLLQRMLDFGRSLEEEIKKKDSSVDFQHGYHAVPSMTRLHMHIISRDFNSPCLKTKKHWNSFTSEFFLPAEDVIRRLQAYGKVEVDKVKYEGILKSPLKCHVCHVVCKNMPTLKAHILQH